MSSASSAEGSGASSSVTSSSFFLARARKPVDYLHHPEYDEGDQEEVDDGADQVADGEDPHFDGGDALGAFSADQGDDGVDNVVHHCRDDGGKGGADDHAYGQINDIASHEEGFEFVNPRGFLHSVYILSLSFYAQVRAGRALSASNRSFKSSTP